MNRRTQPDVEAMTRRALMRAGGCAALTHTSLLSTFFQLSATNAAVAAAGDLSGYKALVCIFMFGGNDSFNTLTPLGGNAANGPRADYLQIRGGEYEAGSNTGALGLPLNGLHTLRDAQTGRDYGLHPALDGLAGLYNENKLTFLNNVGSLVEPTTMSDYQADSKLPVGLFSHADLQQHWMTSVPETRSQVTGWAGRMADIIGGTNVNTGSSISMCVSLDTVNILQTGGQTVPYIISGDGASEVQAYGQDWHRERIFTDLTDHLISPQREYENLLERTFAGQTKTAIEAAIEFNGVIGVDDSMDAYFSDNPTNLERQLRMVAKTIAGRQALNQNRQIFFVPHYGYDNHDELINNHQGNMYDINRSLSAFQAAMDGEGLSDNVVLFTASDFARTLTSNGNGSDHGWGGNQIIMGGPVRGGRMYGHYPDSLTAPKAPQSMGGYDLDTGRGRLLPTTSVDEYACDLAMWYGIANDNSMTDILPNIRKFAGSGEVPLGMLEG